MTNKNDNKTNAVIEDMQSTYVELERLVVLAKTRKLNMFNLNLLALLNAAHSFGADARFGWQTVEFTVDEKAQRVIEEEFVREWFTDQIHEILGYIEEDGNGSWLMLEASFPIYTIINADYLKTIDVLN